MLDLGTNIRLASYLARLLAMTLHRMARRNLICFREEVFMGYGGGSGYVYGYKSS